MQHRDFYVGPKLVNVSGLEDQFGNKWLSFQQQEAQAFISLKMFISRKTDVLAELVGSGIVAGLVLSIAVSRVLANQLWGVSAHDPLTLAAVVGVVLLAGLAACYFPARRATRIDPMIALRHE